MTSLSSKLTDSKQNKPGKRSTKFGSVFKKVGHYLQNQAQEQSHSALYLAPPDRHRATPTRLDDDDLLRTLRASQLAQPYGVIPPLSSDNETPRSSTSMATNDASGPGIFKDMKRIQYASENINQSYDVLVPSRPPSDHHLDKPGIFLIFIHGGYFRDPTRTSTSFKPAITQLEESHPEIAASQVSGYASINYRLSPHPAYPQDPSTTPSYTLNNARWPQQHDDIHAALQHLQSNHPQSKRYILIGHSVGACLALLSVVRPTNTTTTSTIVPPLSIIGVAGIYDFPLMHTTHPDYEGMTRNAMEPAQYGDASPACYTVKEYISRWDTGLIPRAAVAKGETATRRVMLAHSHGDELVDWSQVERMQGVLAPDEGGEGGDQAGMEDSGSTSLSVELVTIQGGHYEVLENGELARCIRLAVEAVQS